MEPAEGQLPRPGEHAVPPVEAPTVSLRKQLVYRFQDQNQLRLPIIAILGQGERGLDLLLAKALHAVLDARPLEPLFDGRSVAIRALDDVGRCFAILLSEYEVLVLPPEERLILFAVDVLLDLVVTTGRKATAFILSRHHHKIPDKAVLGEERLQLTCSPEGAARMQSRLLPVRPRYVHLHRLEVSRKPSGTGQALPASQDPEAADGCYRTRAAVAVAIIGVSLPRDRDILGSSQVKTAKELPETLEPATPQAVGLHPEVWNPDLGPWLQAVAADRAQEHPPFREMDKGRRERCLALAQGCSL